MLNPLDLFNKKSAEKPLDSSSEPVVEQPIQIDDIIIHTMPERFRHQTQPTKSSKTTGILIIAGGVIFLMVVSAILYFYVFNKPEVTVKQEEPIATVGPSPEVSKPTPAIDQNQLNPITATTSEPVVLPGDNGLATTTATTTPETIEDEIPIGLILSLDSDNDAMTNAEEILLGTATSTMDTDGDGYIDGAELLNLFDPASATKLIANPNIGVYENQTFKYGLLYPKAFQMSVNGGDDSVMFKSGDNHFFQIIVQTNTTKQTLDAWYAEQLVVSTINDANRLSGPNWQGIKNLDGLTVYLMDSRQNYIFTLAYNPGETNTLDYINLFNMMLKSFTLKQ